MGMQKTRVILEELRYQGFRITKTRKAILLILEQAKLPLSAPELISKLKTSKLPVNKTTVYRELDFLKDQSIVTELNFGEEAMRYELAGDEHHHHLICSNCDKIEDVAMENELAAIERKIARSSKFKIINHTLEFYGLCRDCGVKK